MSEDGTPYWAPTRAEIQTWEAPSGVSKGRGFVPAGRGRGIAKWSSQDEKPVGSSRLRNSSSLDRKEGRSRREPGGQYRYNDGGGDGRFDNGVNGRDSVECYKCEGIGHMSWECPSREKTQKNDRPSKRDHGRDRLENGSSSEDTDHRGRGTRTEVGRGQKNGDHARVSKNGDSGRGSRSGDSGRGSRNDTFECYNCNGEGHIARNCPEKERQDEKPRSRGGGGPWRGSDECYKCGGLGHLARNCAESTDGTGDDVASIGVQEDLEEDLFHHGVSSGINFSKYENIDVKVTGDGVVNKICSFEDANLNPVIIKNIRKSNFCMPTPVQKHAIPNITAGRDLMACAQTGSGKTAAFLLPVIDRLLDRGVSATRARGAQTPQVVVISPTRELAIQIKDEARRFSAGSELRAVVAYGGTKSSQQAHQIEEGCNILIATPGRLLDFVNKGVVSFSAVQFLILDEADRMLDMGFREDITSMVRNPDMPNKRDRQTLMFSATFPDEIQRMASEFLNEYLFLSVGIVGGACKDVTQFFHQVSQYEKREKLLEVIQSVYESSPKTYKSLVFVEMKKTADFIASYMCQSGFPTTSIHGDRLQQEREDALKDFKLGRKPVLVATAVAARGLDIKNVELVINYDLPKSIDEYVHRIGRTGRLGNTGRAISFYDAGSDSGISSYLVKILSDAQQTVPDWLVSEARRNPHGLNCSAGRNFGGKDVRTSHESSKDRSSQWK